MDDDNDPWSRSYKHIPFGAGEDVIVNSGTSELQAAQRLMAQCKVKPPGGEFQAVCEREDWSWDEARPVASYPKLILDESLRYARTCRELARRVESDNPDLALTLLRSAILPESSSLAFDSSALGTALWEGWWEGTKRAVDKSVAKLQKLAGELRNVWPGMDEDDKDYVHNIWEKLGRGISNWEAMDENHKDYVDNIMRECAPTLVICVVQSGALQAASVIRDSQDAWNLGIKASMVALEERLGHREDASRLKDECLELLRVNDGLWGEVFDGVVSRSLVPLPTPLPPAPAEVREMLTAFSCVLDSKLGPLLRSMTENVEISHALQDRVDFIVEKLIDLDQRSELTWQQVSRSARRAPDYEEATRGIETSLKNRLGDMWRRLTPGSSEDLVDAEYIYEHCSQLGRGWRMAVLGYCTTAERELEASYRTVRDQLVPASAAEPATVQTLGHLIQSVERLGEWGPKSKPVPSGLGALLSSVGELRRLNSIRKRATHPKGVSQDEVAWVRQALLGNKSGGLLVTILAVRVKQ